MLLDVKLKGLPNEELVQGFPGIPATWPRIAGTVEVRSLPTNTKESLRTPLRVQRISVALMRTDSIVVPSHRPPVAVKKCEKSFLVTRQKEIFRGSDGDKYFALDVNFTLSLPTNKPPCGSISLSKSLEAVYHLYVAVETLNSVANSPVTSSYQFPVRVRRFDTLATFGVFSRPIKNECGSSDHLVSLEWFLPGTAYGPGDKICITLHAQPNKDWPKSRKVRLKRFSAELVQLTRFLVPQAEDQDSNLSEQVQVPPSSAFSNESFEKIETRTRITKESRDFTSAEQEELKGISSTEEIDLTVPSVLHVEGASGMLPKESPLVGYSGRCPFTNSSSLFEIEFHLVLKARFNHAKDVQAEQTITICQFDHSACSKYMNSLVQAAQRLKHLDLRPQPPVKWTEPLDADVRIA